MSYLRFWKREFDMFFASLLMFILLPFFFIVAIGIKCSSAGPIFYLQRRIGKDGCCFFIIKFRTMHVDHSRVSAQTLNWDPDVFLFGSILRRFKIDELPQIVNVLKGDMSFVGPRPCLPETFAEMPEWAKARTKLKPGLTGLAQINGNVFLSWEKRWSYDVTYVQRASLLFDFIVLFKTFLVIIVGEDKFLKRR